MYCRQCKYDLRGQVEFRCPECGAPFDLNSPNTFLDELPTIWKRFGGASVIALRLALAILLTLIYIASFVAVPSLGDCRRITYFEVGSRANLQQIVALWRQQVSQNPSHVEFEKEQAKALLPASVSPTQEASVIRARDSLKKKMDKSIFHSISTVAYSVLMSFILRGRIRRAFLAIDAMAFAFTIVVPISETSLGEWLYPGSIKYLDDFEYVSGLDWRMGKELQENTIVAYEKSPVYVSNCAVAFMDGEVWRIPVEDRDEVLSFREENQPPNIREFLQEHYGIRHGIEFRQQSQQPAQPKSAPDN